LSAAAVETPPLATDDERRARFFQLVEWLRSIPGVCWSCRYVFALVQTDREAGEPGPRERYCHTPSRGCRERANAARATMPPIGGPR
jgi:hypothetical protein